MLLKLALVTFFVLMMVWLVRAARRRPSSMNDGGWDPGYQTYVGSDGSCSQDARDDDACDSDADSDSGGDCSSDGGSSD